MKDKERITLSDGTVVVCNQWGIGNINPFLELCKKLDIKID